jgi:hypothetical protein
MADKKVDLEKKFKELIRKKGVQVKDFCKEIGMSQSNLYGIYKRNSIDTRYLKAITEKYDVPESYFMVAEQDVEYTVSKLIANEKDLVKKFSDDTPT